MSEIKARKEIKKVMKAAERYGWTFKIAGSGHVKGSHPAGFTTTISLTPGRIRIHEIRKYLLLDIYLKPKTELLQTGLGTGDASK